MNLDKIERLVRISTDQENDDFEYDFRNMREDEKNDFVEAKGLIESNILNEYEEKSLDTLHILFPFVGISLAFEKIRKQQKLFESEKTSLINFASTFKTVCTHHSVIGKRASKIAKTVNSHRHKKSAQSMEVKVADSNSRNILH